jgi:hypothetical protein
MKVEIAVGETLRRFLFILHLPKWQAGRPACQDGSLNILLKNLVCLIV